MTITCNPARDAERYYNEAFAQQAADKAAQEEEARELEEAERMAPAIVLQDLQAIKKPGDWFEPGLIAGSYETPDQIFWEAIQNDDTCKNLYAEWAISQAQAALELQQAIANWRGKKLARAVMAERMKARH